MTDRPIAAHSPYADIAPALADYTDRVLFGDVWERPGLSPRDRSLITVATLVALYRTADGAIVQAFCEPRGESFLSADPTTIRAFIKHEVTAAKKPATVRRYIAPSAELTSGLAY